MLVKIKDATLSGKSTNEMEIHFQSNEVSVKEIIEGRVTHEVNLYNQQTEEMFNGLVQPSVAERTVNGYQMKKRKTIDVEQQVYVALDAFQKNGFFLLIDDQQVDQLEQKILLKANTEISFIKLTPLVGG